MQTARLQGHCYRGTELERSSERRSRWTGTTWVWPEAFRGRGQRNMVRSQASTGEWAVQYLRKDLRWAGEGRMG